MHYDLSWNPTRHEQREGRVDRFGQPRPIVRTLTYYGTDNQIDGLVLEVLLRKSKTIRKQTGVSVPVPEGTNSVMEAIFEGLLLREESGGIADRLPGFDDYFRPKREELFLEWEAAAAREKRSHSMFAQASLKPDEVQREWDQVQQAIGSQGDVKGFFVDAFSALGAKLKGTEPLHLDLGETPRAVRDATGLDGTLRVRFEMPVQEGERYLTRTAQPVEGLASYVMSCALDADVDAVASRCGTIRTDAVDKRRTLLLLRFRFDVITRSRGHEDKTQLAEDCGLVGFEGAPNAAAWLDPDSLEELLDARPSGNLPPETAAARVEDVVQSMQALIPNLELEARSRAARLRESHERVRESARQRSVKIEVEPKLPVDVLGIYVFLPSGTRT